jgi:hypothetical protein
VTVPALGRIKAEARTSFTITHMHVHAQENGTALRSRTGLGTFAAHMRPVHEHHGRDRHGDVMSLSLQVSGIEKKRAHVVCLVGERRSQLRAEWNDTIR